MPKLSEIFTLQMGKTPARAKNEYWNNGDNEWISISDLSTYNKYAGHTKETISDLAVADSGIKPVPADTVIMSFKLTIGKAAITVKPTYTNEAIMAFIPNGKQPIEPSYFYHFFTGRDWSKGTNRAVMGATLNKATLGEIDVLVPDIEEQKRIAELLDSVDNLISSRKQQLSKLDELVKSRFIEMFGDLSSNPYGWSVVKISDISRLLKSGLSRKLSDDDIGLPVIRSGNIQNGQFIYDDVKYWYKVDPQGSKTDDYILEDGDILVNFINSASQIGKTAIFRAVGRDCIYTTNIFRMKLAENCNEYYYNWFAMSEYYYRQLQNIIQPAVNQASFTTVNFLKLNIPLPPIELQNQFATFVEQTDKSKFEIQTSLEKLETLKKALMQKYFG